MLEPYRYLCDNGFTFYIVSGSDQQVVGALSRDVLVYGGEPFSFARRIGADVVMELSPEGDRVLLRDETLSLNVNADKCVRIASRIGKTPVVALGNSTGDAAMLTYTLYNDAYPALINHDDDRREAAYHAKAMRALCQPAICAFPCGMILRRSMRTDSLAQTRRIVYNVLNRYFFTAPRRSSDRKG